MKAWVVPQACAWCPDPAEEQVLMGRTRVASKTKKYANVYAWLCGRCAKDAKTEKEWSRGG